MQTYQAPIICSHLEPLGGRASLFLIGSGTTSSHLHLTLLVTFGMALCKGLFLKQPCKKDLLGIHNRKPSSLSEWTSTSWLCTFARLTSDPWPSTGCSFTIFVVLPALPKTLTSNLLAAPAWSPIDGRSSPWTQHLHLFSAVEGSASSLSAFVDPL